MNNKTKIENHIVNYFVKNQDRAVFGKFHSIEIDGEPFFLTVGIWEKVKLRYERIDKVKIYLEKRALRNVMKPVELNKKVNKI